VPLIVRWPEAIRPPERTPGSVDDQLVSFVDLAPTLLRMAGAPLQDGLHGRDFLSRDSSHDTPKRLYIYAARDRIDEVRDRERAVRDQRYKYIRSWSPESSLGHPLGFRDNIEMVRELHALHLAGALDAEQGRWFAPFGRERLFDTAADPHELHDLSAAPEHAEVLARMRGALSDWLSRTPDWSETSEREMVARFAREGSLGVTAAPAVRVVGGEVEIASETGASLGYRVDGGPWRLYSAPFEAPPGSTLDAKAVRYGWDESSVVQVRSPE